MLALPVTLERVQPVSWRHIQVFQARSQINVLKFSRGSISDVRGKAFRASAEEKVTRALVGERFDHHP